jgi:hypothetical protein
MYEIASKTLGVDKFAMRTTESDNRSPPASSSPSPQVEMAGQCHRYSIGSLLTVHRSRSSSDKARSSMQSDNLHPLPMQLFMVVDWLVCTRTRLHEMIFLLYRAFSELLGGFYLVLYRRLDYISYAIVYAPISLTPSSIELGGMGRRNSRNHKDHDFIRSRADYDVPYSPDTDSDFDYDDYASYMRSNLEEVVGSLPTRPTNENLSKPGVQASHRRQNISECKLGCIA